MARPGGSHREAKIRTRPRHLTVTANVGVDASRAYRLVVVQPTRRQRLMPAGQAPPQGDLGQRVNRVQPTSE